jgi:hypothetical protein|tara:strand:- start:1243 stop:1620 length:378 start_codon:yes stop_codon:yes gene_type:complete
MSTIKVTNLQDTSGGNSSTSEQIAQGRAKAWINFDGTSGSIGSGRDSFNVTSVTDNGTGKYTINFTNDMANANYAVVISSNMSASNSNAAYERIESISTSDVAIRVIHSGAFQDTSIVCAAVFGD